MVNIESDTIVSYNILFMSVIDYKLQFSSHHKLILLAALG